MATKAEVQDDADGEGAACLAFRGRGNARDLMTCRMVMRCMVGALCLIPGRRSKPPFRG